MFNLKRYAQEELIEEIEQIEPEEFENSSVPAPIEQEIPEAPVSIDSEVPMESDKNQQIVKGAYDVAIKFADITSEINPTTLSSIINRVLSNVKGYLEAV